jgi:hypothetical protein
VCKYQFRDGSICKEQNYEDSEYCILHVDLPDDEDSEEWEKFNKLKQKEYDRKVSQKELKFEGAIFGDLQNKNKKISHLSFSDIKIYRFAMFSETEFHRLEFDNVEFHDIANFSAIKIGSAKFQKISFYSRVDFGGAQIARTSFKNIFFRGPIKSERVLIRWLEIGKEINWIVNFRGSTFNWVKFEVVKSYNELRFDESKFIESIIFDDIELFDDITFKKSYFENECMFRSIKVPEQEIGSKISIRFDHAKSERNICIENSNFDSNSILSMIGTAIKGDLKIENVNLSGLANFNNLNVSGDITINPNNILNPYAQVNIFRKVKTHSAELGDKKTSDKYFFLEKVAVKEILKIEINQSIQKLGETFFSQDFSVYLKPFFVKIIEYFFEWPMHHYFLYGVRPWRTFGYWIGIIFIFAGIYSYFDLPPLSSPWDYLYFSVTNAMTPGYGGITPGSGTPRLVASIEAIFGAFTWGCFLTIFARKYMDK